MDGDHPFLSICVVSFSFMACSGLHVSLRLLSLLRVMNISPSQKKQKEKSACVTWNRLRQNLRITGNETGVWPDCDTVQVDTNSRMVT